ncbi:MAG: hypothetical protein U0942_13510 [Parvibaculum sp.]|jgi:hypothetical protein|uniref:hypothetical protein n=1 Tax=Parvibaculum sp. TaxID=2024848 RepID=UPI002ABC646F|nr:hypothetical protein [Parvibaculum sp.]MDZ4382348.1 hypothetical protein [Parvibaculum sp.]
MSAQQGRIPAETLQPIDLVDRLLDLTSGLTSIVRRETDLLRDRAQAEVAALQPEKIRLANDYAMDVMAVRGHRNLLDRAPSERVSRLKAAMGELDRALALNGEALMAAKSVSEGLIRMVANAMSERAAPALGYGPNAATAARRAGGPAGAGSLTLDSRA